MRASINAGLLCHRVTLQEPAETADEYGQMIPGWASLGTFWAGVEPLQGREAERARQLIATATHKVTLRWLGPDVIPRPQPRIVFGSRILHIEAVLNLDEGDHHYQVLAMEVV